MELLRTGKLTKEDIKVGMKVVHSIRGKATVHRLEVSNPDPTSVFVVFDGEGLIEIEEISLALLKRGK